jgi:hypothetical protein
MRKTTASVLAELSISEQIYEPHRPQGEETTGPAEVFVHGDGAEEAALVKMSAIPPDSSLPSAFRD